MQASVVQQKVGVTNGGARVSKFAAGNRVIQAHSRNTKVQNSYSRQQAHAICMTVDKGSALAVFAAEGRAIHSMH